MRHKKVIATCKHFAAYDFEETQQVTRAGFNAIVSTQELSEYYLPPFKNLCCRDASGAFMCSYNSVNGIPACASPYLLEDIIRQHWK